MYNYSAAQKAIAQRPRFISNHFCTRWDNYQIIEGKICLHASINSQLYECRMPPSGTPRIGLTLAHINVSFIVTVPPTEAKDEELLMDNVLRKQELFV